MDKPTVGLRAGDVGAIVDVYSPLAFDVEFVTGPGEPQALLTLQTAEIRPLGKTDLMAVRSVAVKCGSRLVLNRNGIENMQIIRSREFAPDKAWAALDIANMRGITTRLHWTDQPYKWHVNDGEEVFAVLDGVVEMKYKLDGEVFSALLNAGDIFHASTGTEHVACPKGEARILVIEVEGSV